MNPKTVESAAHRQLVSSAFARLMAELSPHLPENRARQLMMERLSEARMWATVAGSELASWALAGAPPIQERKGEAE